VNFRSGPWATKTRSVEVDCKGKNKIVSDDTESERWHVTQDITKRSQTWPLLQPLFTSVAEGGRTGTSVGRTSRRTSSSRREISGAERYRCPSPSRIPSEASEGEQAPVELPRLDLIVLRSSAYHISRGGERPQSGPRAADRPTRTYFRLLSPPQHAPQYVRAPGRARAVSPVRQGRTHARPRADMELSQVRQVRGITYENFRNPIYADLISL
jgi:hypothetical protein